MLESNHHIVTLLRAQTYKLTPWKNGKGRSAEIAIFPPDAKFPADDFLWRLSSASLLSDGPFSKFPGYQRYLALIAPGSLKLCFASGEEKLLKAGELDRFNGEDTVLAKLLGGPTQDLNLIFADKNVQANFSIRRLEGHESFSSSASACLIFVITGAIVATVNGAKHTANLLEVNDTLQVLQNGVNPTNAAISLDAKMHPASYALAELSW